MVPKAGKWRFDTKSILMLSCPYSKGCLQPSHFDEETQHGLCAPHHQGELCGECEAGYALHDCKTFFEILISKYSKYRFEKMCEM